MESADVPGMKAESKDNFYFVVIEPIDRSIG
jgi:hypothetical protein